MDKEYNFLPITEAEISREMATRYMQDLVDYAECDVVVVGAGPAGLMAAYELGKHNVKTALIEANISPGGGAWVAGQLFSAMVIRKPADKILDELGVPYIEKDNYVILKHAAQYTSQVLAKALSHESVKLFNGVAVEDLMTENNEAVRGVVTNWMPVTKLHGQQCCMDPNMIASKVVISSCGHDGPFGASGVKRLKQIGMFDDVPGMKALDVNASERDIIKYTSEVVPGMILAGMEVAEAYGTNRMGPSFGAMLVSGQKAAHIAMRKLGVDFGESPYLCEETSASREFSTV